MGVFRLLPKRLSIESRLDVELFGWTDGEENVELDLLSAIVDGSGVDGIVDDSIGSVCSDEDGFFDNVNKDRML